MEEYCSYCKKSDFEKWEKGKTYVGLDLHHNPPEFLFGFGETWEGKRYYLCRKCHKELHQEIKKILNRVVGTMKFCNSEDWLLKKMSITQMREARIEVWEFTEKWIKRGKDGDTK